MPILKPGTTDPLFDIEITDGRFSWLLRADGGTKAILESKVEGSNDFVPGGIGTHGTGEPGEAVSQQRTWEGGRGNDNFFTDPTSYFDARMAWSPTPDVLTHAPQWKLSDGYRDQDFNLPGSVSWKGLEDAQLYISHKFTASASYSATQILLWLRRIGDPGTLTAALYSDSAGDPNTLLQSKTATIGDINDVLSELYTFAITSQSLTSSTDYHIVVFGATTDNMQSHWQIGVDESSTGVQISSDGTTWAPQGYGLYYWVKGANVNGRWNFFRNDALYSAFEYDDGTPSTLFINGIRGKATGGSSTTLADNDITMVANEHQGAFIKTLAGRGQRQEVASHGVSTFTVSNFDVAPTTTSEYVVYASPKWTNITPGSGDQIDGTIQSIATFNKISIFAQGDETADPVALKMRFNAAAVPPDHEFADDTGNKAALIFTGYDPTNGVQIWRATNTDVSMSRGAATLWGTAITYGTAIPVGDSTYLITGIAQGGEPIYVTKEDSIGFIKNDEYTPLPVPLDSMPEHTNGQAILVHGEFIYFNWTYSLERLFGDIVNADNLNLDDVDINRGAGLPGNRQGPISAITTHPVGPIMSIDGGDSGRSSVLMFDGRAFFELFRAWKDGVRIRNLFLQGNDDTRPRLWMSVGDDIVYLDLPLHHRNPLKDTALPYMHEFVLETSTFNFGNTEIKKAFKKLQVNSENLNKAGIVLYLDYQTDENIGSNNWNTYAGTYHLSPVDDVRIDVGRKQAIRFRLRGYTDVATTPVKVFATVLTGFGKRPLKLQWNMPVRLSEVEEVLGGPDPTDFMTWLGDIAENAEVVHMFSRSPRLHDRKVIVNEGDFHMNYIDAIEQSFSGVLEIALREYG